jgi:hypothetical protein
MAGMEKRKKRVLLIGTALGGGASLVVFFLTDMMFADMQQGTWRDAIAHDLNRMLSASFTPWSIPVVLVYIAVMLMLVAFGAFLGVIFSMFVARLLDFLGGGGGS